MTELSVLLDMISDRQLREYVAWLDAHPDSDEEDSIDYLMEIMTDSQIDMLLEMEEFNATPYSGGLVPVCYLMAGVWKLACRVLGGRFQGPGTSCGGHYTKPVMYQSEDDQFLAELVKELPRSGDNIFAKELWVGNDSSQANATAQNYLLNKHPNKNIIYTLSGLSDYNKVLVNYMFVGPEDEKEYNAPTGKVFHDPAAARDPRLKNDKPPSSVTQYLKKHPEVANLYDDDDASVMVKGIIIGCLIGALGTIFGNLASEMIMDKFKINPQFKWDQ